MAKTLSRLVLNFPGFETTSAVHQIERLSAGGQKTAELWAFDLEAGEIIDEPGSHQTMRDYYASGNGWKTSTRYVHFSWGDIIGKYENVPYPKSLFRHFPDYAAFFLDGSVWRYFKASARYWGFTVYPMILIILFAILGWFASGFLLGIFGLGNWLVQLVLTALITLILCKFPGDRFYVNLSINDWAFARDMCLGRNPEIDARYDLFAKQVITEIETTKADEILIVGHSFGSVWAVMALARALEQKPDLLADKQVTFLAMGSSLLKIGLVKNADFLRNAIASILKLDNLVWHEIQTKTDFVSFYKSEPFEPMGISETSAEVILHRVNFKKALSKQRHRKMMKSMYLAHRQYILYCDTRVHHDYQLRVFGPYLAADLARDTELALTSSYFKQDATSA